jgi:uncharacterized membrane protein (DUF485 family)
MLEPLLFKLTKPIFLILFPKIDEKKYDTLKKNFSDFYLMISFKLKIMIFFYLLFIYLVSFFNLIFLKKKPLKNTINFLINSKVYILASGINLLKSHSIILQYSYED